MAGLEVDAADPIVLSSSDDEEELECTHQEGLNGPSSFAEHRPAAHLSPSPTIESSNQAGEGEGAALTEPLLSAPDAIPPGSIVHCPDVHIKSLSQLLLFSSQLAAAPALYARGQPFESGAFSAQSVGDLLGLGGGENEAPASPFVHRNSPSPTFSGPPSPFVPHPCARLRIVERLERLDMIQFRYADPFDMQVAELPGAEIDLTEELDEQPPSGSPHGRPPPAEPAHGVPAQCEATGAPGGSYPDGQEEPTLDGRRTIDLTESPEKGGHPLGGGGSKEGEMGDALRGFQLSGQEGAREDGDMQAPYECMPSAELLQFADEVDAFAEFDYDAFVAQLCAQEGSALARRESMRFSSETARDKWLRRSLRNAAFSDQFDQRVAYTLHFLHFLTCFNTISLGARVPF